MNSTESIKLHFSLAKNIALHLPDENDRGKTFKYIKMIEDVTSEELQQTRYHAIRLLLASLISNHFHPPFNVDPSTDQDFVSYNWFSYKFKRNNSWEDKLNILLTKEFQQQKFKTTTDGAPTNFVFEDHSSNQCHNVCDGASSSSQNDSPKNGNNHDATQIFSFETFCYNCAPEIEYDGPRLEGGKVTKEFMKELLRHFERQKKLHEAYAEKILFEVYDYFHKQPTVIDLRLPPNGRLTICGDVHGQFYDLLNIFKINGLPSSNNPYLFNGDIVDRGAFSVECIFTIFSYKLLYPNHIFITRGNHECKDMNLLHGFAAEVEEKYSLKMFDMFTEIFNWLPLCHLINNKVLVIHGGLFSKDNVTLHDLRHIKRNMQPPEEGLMVELLWSDPQIFPGRIPSKRGVGVMFGPDVTSAFCTLNNLEYIVRSHELKYLGYEEAHNKQCITIFSAPNYNDQMGNYGAIMIINGYDLKPAFVTFHAVVDNKNFLYMHPEHIYFFLLKPHPTVKRKLALVLPANHRR